MDVFVSYSRRDAGFVTRLVAALNERGKEAWVDVDGIRDAEVFPAALRTAVEGSDGFVFVISPDSIASAYCAQEIEHAVELNKRIVPLALRDVRGDDVPEAIRVRNWIPVGEDTQFEDGVERLVEALDTDLDWTKEHTRWLLKALEWDAERRERSLLLRGAELDAAERWLARASGRDPRPTTQQAEYIAASRLAASRRQRIVVGASLVVAAVSVALLVFALVSRQAAVSAQATAKSRALAAQSENQAGVDPELAILLGEQAVRTKATPDALFALRGALDAAPLLRRLPAPKARCPFSDGPTVAYDPVGPLIAEGHCNGQVVVFDSATGRVVRRLAVTKSAPAVAYSPDGNELAIGTDHGGLVVDARSGAIRERLTGASRVIAIAFSPDGSRVAAAAASGVGRGSNGVGLWSLSGGRVRTIAPLPRLSFLPPGATSNQDTVAFTPDGRFLVVGGGPQSVRIEDAKTGRGLRLLPGTELADAVAAAPRGGEVAVAALPADGGTVTLWREDGWRRIATVAHFAALEITALAFGPGGRLAIGAADGSGGVWSTATDAQLVAYRGPDAAVASMSFAPDGRSVAAVSVDGTAEVWRAGGPELATIPTGSTQVDHMVLTGSRLTISTTATAQPQSSPGVVRSWSLPGGRPTTPLDLHNSGGGPGWLSLDGALVAAPPGGPTGPVPPSGHPPRGRGRPSTRPQAVEVSIWNLAERRVVRRLRTTPSLSDVAFSGDSTRAAVFDQYHSSIYDLATGRALSLESSGTPCNAGWRSAAFTHNGSLLAAGTFCGNVTVWDARTGRVRWSFDNPGELSQLAWSPNDKHLAVGSWNDNITIWNLETRSVEHVLAGHTRGVSSIAYSADGSLLASGSLDDTARIWDPSSGRVLRILHQSTPVGPVTFAPSGHTLATGGDAVRLWDACSACGNAKALLRLAAARVTRGLTPLERRTFLGGY
jgi:WD40 repeat protein